MGEQYDLELKKYKIRFILFLLLVSMLLFFLLFMIKKTVSSYISEVDIQPEIQNAVYIFKEGTFQFHLDLDQIVPREEPYVYTFTVANYQDSQRSDVDIEYEISMLSTTNLPLRYEVYRNQSYDDAHASSIITKDELVRDVDQSWYQSMKLGDKYSLYHTSNTLDTYSLIVYFPLTYSNNLSYEGLIDNIEITIHSKQIID